MNDPVESVELAVTIIANENGEILFDYQSTWGSFSLPQSVVGSGSPEAAALRAAVEVLGHPLMKGHRPKHVDVKIPPLPQISPSGAPVSLHVHVFALRAPAGKACPLHGHSSVWLPRDGLADLAPVAPMVEPVLDAVPTVVWAGLMGG